MPEIKTEIVDTNVKYDKSNQDDIVSQIVKNWDKWDEDRRPQLDIIERLAEFLDVETPVVEYEVTFTDENDKEYKKAVNKLKDADIVQLRNSAIAHTYNSTYKTPAQLINIELEDQLNDSAKAQIAYLQKAALLKVWKKARAKKECRKATENWYDKGEQIFYVNWSQVFQNIRRKNPTNKIINVLGKPFGIKLPEWQVQRVLKYDGVKIKCIDPENYVLDVTREGEEGCPEIYRSWKIYQDIAENEEFKEFLDSEALKELEGSDINYIAGHCILMFYKPHSIHKFHGSLKKFFGGWPKKAK